MREKCAGRSGRRTFPGLSLRGVSAESGFARADERAWGEPPMMRVSMPFESWASKTAMTFGTGLLLAASATAAPRHIEKHFKVGVHPVITIHNPDGIVTIKAWTRPEVKLVGDSQSDKVEIDADQTGNR